MVALYDPETTEVLGVAAFPRERSLLPRNSRADVRGDLTTILASVLAILAVSLGRAAQRDSRKLQRQRNGLL
jgi:hypothetical protein